jgi:integrase
MKQADLEGVTAHTFRHTFASVAADLGYADATIASLLGHAGATVTSRYVHVLDSVLVSAADRVTAHINSWLS